MLLFYMQTIMCTIVISILETMCVFPASHAGCETVIQIAPYAMVHNETCLALRFNTVYSSAALSKCI